MDRTITSLPKDVERPKVIKASVTDIPAFYLNLSLKMVFRPKRGSLVKRVLILASWDSLLVT